MDDLKALIEHMAKALVDKPDAVSLIEKAQEVIDRDQAEAIARKLRADTLTLEDFRDQLKQVTKLGCLEQVLDLLPGGQRLKELTAGSMPGQDKAVGRMAAIIDSMTPRERRDHTLLTGSRKQRIAKGSGTSVQDVNRLIKQYLEARKMMKMLSGRGGRQWLGRSSRTFS